MTLDSYVFSSEGGRSLNEDSAAAVSLDNGDVFVVADGLGGHRYGDVASGIVVETFKDIENPGENPAQWIIDRLSLANKTICMEQENRHCTMKSTAAVLLIEEDIAFWAHVGDTRVYYMHKGKIAAVTEDHSVAYKKYKAGEITRAQIATDEDQSSLLRALGNSDRAKPDSGGTAEPLEEGDGFLVCSDGLWEYVRDEEALTDFLKAENAEEWAELMLLRVMERTDGENDNLSLITVIVSA